MLQKLWQDIAALTESLQAKIQEANEKCSTLQTQLKESLEENSRLQVTINVLKKKPCSKCAKLIDCTEMLKKKLKEKDDTISVIGKDKLNSEFFYFITIPFAFHSSPSFPEYLNIKFLILESLEY